VRILVTAFPGEGHLQPMLPLMTASRRAGHDVVVATGPDLAPLVERRGFTVWALGPTMAEAFAPRDDIRVPEQVEGRFVIPGTVVFAPAAERLAAELVPRAVPWQPDLVVSEVMQLAGLAVAAETGAAQVVHGVGPLPIPAHWSDVPALAQLCDRWGLAQPLGGLLSATYLDVCPPSLHVREHAATQRLRPLRPAAGDSGDLGDVAERMAALPYPQTVHLTLGTIFNKSLEVYDAALSGLCDLDLNVVVTVGADVDPASLGPQPANVLVERYLPHAALLSHCTAVVSHGGAATMLAALRHGLPQLVLPRGADQFDNAEAAVRAGAALSLTEQTVDRAAVVEQTRRLLTEPSFAAAARRVQAEIEAMPDPDDVLASLVDELAHAGARH
jgi:UDP:flavonoid glycosyltransferase YjiC (YdhE family)